MRALVLTELHAFPTLREIPAPQPTDHQIVARVLAAALNRRDYWITQGQYPGIVLPVVLGSDAVVEHEGQQWIVNPNLNWGPDERVQSKDYHILGLPTQGAFAEEIAVAKDRLHPKPAHLTLEEAAALPLGGLTAYRALVVKCQPKSGERVLITGVGGGVAMFAFQFALALGCEVWVTSGSDEKISDAIALGAKGGANYKNENWGKELTNAASGGFDVIIDSAGGPGFATLTKIANPGGRIAQYGGTRGKMTISPQIFFWKQLTFFGSTMGSDADFADMIDFVNQHRILPVVDAVFPLEEGAKAFQKLAQSSQFGKVVLKI